MGIISVTDIKAHLGIDSGIDDALLSMYCAAAQCTVEYRTRRRFEAVIETRRFGIDKCQHGILRVDDLLSVTSLVDGTGRTRVATDYRLEPLNASRFRMIRALAAMGGNWVFTPDGLVLVTGLWGYSATVPDAIRLAITQLAAWIYRQKDASIDLDRPIIGNDGVVLAPAGLPKGVVELFMPYRDISL